MEDRILNKTKSIDRPLHTFLPAEIKGFDRLAEMALDMYWYWNHAADEVWRELDPVLWELTYNPWMVLQTVSRDHLKQRLAERKFRRKVDHLLQATREQAAQPAWFQQTHPQTPLSAVAYFCMEFMLSEALPIYSGGLGNVAGDQLKTAGDLGVPVIGIGLLYQQGYFRQVINEDGAQQALFPYNDPGQLPIMPLRKPNGEWLRLKLRWPGYSVWLRTWQVQIGRVRLYLLDSNDPANYLTHRGITSELYGAGSELRLNQELVLGIGGLRLLDALGIKPEVCHLNEGHAAFAVLERARTFMAETGQPFEGALAVTRAGNLFTTHTPVDAGFDRFDPALIEHYLAQYAQDELGLPLRNLLALGRRDPDDAAEPFNMAYLAIRGSGAVNGVSRLHGQVSRRLFQPLFPRWPEKEVPIGHVTNGVHMSSWDSEEADALWTDACGKDRWLGTLENIDEDMKRVSDARLWECRTSARGTLIEYVRNRLTRQLEAVNAPPEEIEHAKGIFDFDVLTLGFARRFAAYKRPNLLLHDPARLLRILTSTDRPVQLIIAGKAHPADKTGQGMIQQWNQFIWWTKAHHRVIFLSDYDMLLTGQLVQGVDVWINTPRRPWEACGTSGMKVLVNGGLNLSELDGWWAEAYTPGVGWALGDGKEHEDDKAWDAREAEVLYNLLEQEVIPEFYTRGPEGFPAAWVARIRESMTLLTPRFSANRTVREYTEQHYLPAAKAYRERAADKGAMGARFVEWRHRLEINWPHLHFGEVKISSDHGLHKFQVEVYLKDLDPDTVLVELYVEGAKDDGPIIYEMSRIQDQTGASGHLYQAEVPADRPAEFYTPRLIPRFPQLAVPLEAPFILWQR
jgi:glycogen phosphorylase